MEGRGLLLLHSTTSPAPDWVEGPQGVAAGEGNVAAAAAAADKTSRAQNSFRGKNLNNFNFKDFQSLSFGGHILPFAWNLRSLWWVIQSPSGLNLWSHEIKLLWTNCFERLSLSVWDKDSVPRNFWDNITLMIRDVVSIEKCRIGHCVTAIT